MQLKGRIPYTEAWRDRVIKNKAEQDVLLERTKENLKKEQTKEALKKNEGPGSAIEKKASSPEGRHIADFKERLYDAIIYGYRRDDTAGSTDAAIRNAVREEGFMNKIAYATAASPFATPIESEDVKYASELGDVRRKLGKKLAEGKVNSLSSSELDIIISAIMASSADIKPPKGKEPKSQIDDEPIMQQAFDAFFAFLESAAQNSAQGNEGMFIASVLLELASRNTMEDDLKVDTIRRLAHMELIDNKLSATADFMLEDAVNRFKYALDRELAMSTATLNPELDVPGLGYGRDGKDRAQGSDKRAGSCEQEMPSISKKFQDLFRSAFMECRIKNVKLNVDLLGDNGHPLVMAFVVQAKTVAEFIAEYGRDKAGTKIDALEKSVSGIQLPETVKDEMKAIVAQMRGTTAPKKGIAAPAPGKEAGENEIAVANPDIASNIDKLEKRYGYPVKKAAAWAAENYSQIRTGRIPDEQWITARLKFQHETSPKIKPIKPSKFRRLKNDTQKMIHGQLPDAWYLRVPIFAGNFFIPYYPGKWFVKATFLNNNLKEGTRDLQSSFIGKDEEPKKSWWKKKYTGILQAAFAVLVVADLTGSLVSSVNFSKHYDHNGWKGAKAWYFRWPPRQLSAAPGRMLFRWPWQWPMVVPGRYDTLKVCDDDMNIPQKLSSRPYSYFRSAFGVGNDSSAQASKRLDWLKAHPGVLQFFQERTSGVHVNAVYDLPKNPGTTLKYDTATINGHVTTTRVWRTLKLETTPITDGLMLNKFNADAFVDTLRAMEKRDANGHGILGIGAKNLDYPFMEANRLSWENDGFLVNKEKLEIMNQLRINDNSNAIFVAFQPAAKDLLKPYATLGDSTKYITQPDTFVAHWRNEITALTGSDPMQTIALQQDLQRAFDSTMAELKGIAIRDATPEFEAAGIARIYGVADTTRSLLTTHGDIRKLLLQFEGKTGYYLNQNRIDDFVQYLIGKRADDFNPFKQGAQTGWAMTEGYFGTNPYTALGAEDTSHAAAVQKHLGAGTLSSDARAFYASPGGAQLDTVLSQMKADDGARQKVYHILTDTSDDMPGRRALATLVVSGSGANLSVTVRNKERAKTWLATYMKY
jgi:hypothetical protein